VIGEDNMKITMILFMLNYFGGGNCSVFLP
jgi:hypothetical protein